MADDELAALMWTILWEPWLDSWQTWHLQAWKHEDPQELKAQHEALAGMSGQVTRPAPGGH